MFYRNSSRSRRARKARTAKTQLYLEQLESLTLLSAGQWLAVFGGMTPGITLADQIGYGKSLLDFAGVDDGDVEVTQALDLSGAFVVETAPEVTLDELTAQLEAVPGFIYATEYTEPDPATFRKEQPARLRSEAFYGPFDYDTFLSREKNGEFPPQDGPVEPDPLDSLNNNNDGSTGTSNFTQSETTIVAFGSTIVTGFNDSGSNAGGTNKFTGFARSTDGGLTFTDGGTLPTNAGGDAGDPVLARNDTTGRLYLSTLGFSVDTIQMFRSDDGGATWMLPVNATPGGSSEDKQWHTVDNFPGAGNGNVYVLSRRFGAGPGIYFFRSTDHGATFGPSAGTLIVSGQQGAFVTVGPDHAVYAFWWNGTTLQMRKSTDQGVSFGAPVTVASGLTGGVNGDLGLTGLRNGLATFEAFRSNSFPHAAVNPISGHVYVTFNDNPAGVDKGDVFMVMSTDGGATWGARVRVNDDVTTTDQWQPTIAVTPDGAKLGIFYSSRQEDTVSNNEFKHYGRLGTISGATVTFAPSFAVSDVPSLPEFGRDPIIVATYMGDYNHAAATAGAFHVVWGDNRDDLPGGAPRKDPQVYYEKIALGLSVTTTVPAVGSVVMTAPTTFTVNTTEPVLSGTLQASDFLVNGIPADSVSYTAGTTTIDFMYASSPVTAEGLQTMHIDAGAFTRDPDGDPVLEFNGTFRYDTLLLEVTSTVPPFPGGVFTLPGPFTYDVNFNEMVDPTSVQTSDLMLSGIPGAFVSGVTVLPGNTTARFTLAGIATEGSLTTSINAGAISDGFGNPGAAFSATYVVDIGTIPYPTPLGGKVPAGSLVYDPSYAGTIGFAGDADNFTIAVDPGQTITLIVTPGATLRPRVELFDPSNASLGSATAPAAGQVAGLQSITAATAGTYRIAVEGAGGTTGGYTLEVILNAAFEQEGRIAGATNDTIGTAQGIDPNFLPLQTSLSTADRAAVLGATDPGAGYTAAPVPFAFEDISATGTIIAGLTGVDDVSVSIPVGFTFPFYGLGYSTIFVSSNALLTFVTGNSAFTNTDLTATPTQASIAPFWDDLHTAGGAAGSNVFFQVLGVGMDQHLTIQWNQIRFFSGGAVGDTLTLQAQLFVDGRIRFNYLDLVSGGAAGNNGGSATVGIKDAGPQGPNRLLLAFNNGPNAFVGTGQSTLISPPMLVGDYYAFSASAGDVVTLGVASLVPGVVTVELRNAADAVLATGVGATNLNSVINNFVIGATGTYYARVGGGPSIRYDLLVTRNAAFDTEANDAFATAQDVTGTRGALGGIAPSGVYVASAVPFGFEDISGTGTIIAGLTGVDDVSVSIPVGFTFPFYGVNYTTIFVSSNALLTFGTGNSAFTNTDLTTTPTQASIAAFWDDLHTAGGAAGSNVFFQVLGAGMDQHLTIQWNQIRFFSGGAAGDTLTLQAQLFVDGRIRFNYLDLVSGGAAGNNGGSATVGIKDAGPQGPNRLLLAFNNGPNVFVGTGQSTLIAQPPGDDWYSVTLGAGQTVLQVETSTPGDGPGEPANLLNPHIELYDPGGVLIAMGTPLPDGRNESLLVTGLAAGSYRVRVSGEASTQGDYYVGVTPLRSPTPSKIVDNSNFGFQVFGPGWSLVPGGFNGNRREHAGGGTGANFAQFTYGQTFTAGTSYEFFATWVPGAGNGSNVPFKVRENAALLATVLVNQKVTPNSAFVAGAFWKSIFVYTPATTGFKVIRIQIGDNANGTVVADAIFDPPLVVAGTSPACATLDRPIASDAAVAAVVKPVSPVALPNRVTSALESVLSARTSLTDNLTRLLDAAALQRYADVQASAAADAGGVDQVLSSEEWKDLTPVSTLRRRRATLIGWDEADLF